jgi:hypothetical protein
VGIDVDVVTQLRLGERDRRREGGGPPRQQGEQAPHTTHIDTNGEDLSDLGAA